MVLKDDALDTCLTFELLSKPQWPMPMIHCGLLGFINDKHVYFAVSDQNGLGPTPTIDLEAE